MAYSHVTESTMTSIDPVMELAIEKCTLSWSKNPENDTQFNGTSPYGKIYECPHTLGKRHW